ncbi:uncharacterized protein KY384_003839 [Bacidia gigantensis]|uniref:uncharacterized protein n=1 Tax=Bacidia gigantensis TaxID=2732470 RepID=UPI001D04D6DB|nr:uncharacterized protein KY384_003839 [Bacidia gigantensis]KAG8532198.1 hypothetical protein KY384_003839 [Bacidia gigantensis]
MAYETLTSNKPSSLSDVSDDQELEGFETPNDSTMRLESPNNDQKEPTGMSNSNETSSLLSSEGESIHRQSGSDDSLRSLDYHDAKDAPEPLKSVFYLFILTLSVGGLQISWATENSNGTPYLQSLGMSKSLLALVWIAGPLTGVLVQPYIGIRSDNCRLRWGKRLPFMVAGAIATSVSFLCLAWARGIVQSILGIFGADAESNGVKVCIIIFAIVCVYVLDFSINTVQAGIRAFIVDNAPYHQQEDANAWAGRITGVGNILGFLSGYVDLPKQFPWLGGTQMQVLCAISAFAICVTVLISALYIRERDPSADGPPITKNPGLISFFTQTYRSAKRMPPQIRKVCVAQFFNWLGWFGFLFYMTTYVGQVKLNPYFDSHDNLTPEEIEDAWEDATRDATFALLLFAITSFAASIVLPLFITRTYALSPSTNQSEHVDRITAPRPSALRARLDRFLSRLQIQWLTLRRAWLMSHIIFAICMFSTFLVFNYAGATALTAFIGLPWAMSLWAPFALISAEVSKRDTRARRQVEQGRGEGEQEDQAGVIMGLHNVAISAPQILATIVASIIFQIAQKPRGQPYDSSVGWVLSFGGVTALAAAYFTYRIGEEGDEWKARDGVQDYERVGEHREADAV